MDRRINLLEDDIGKSLFRMAMPLMGTAFIQMAYSLTDVMWLGRLSTNAVAAVGTCSFFVWIANAITLIAKTGISVGLAQAYGKNDFRESKEVMRAGIHVNLVFCLLVGSILYFFRDSILGFYHLPETVHQMAYQYLGIIALGMFFTFMNPVFSATFYARGNSVTPFKVSVIALVLNIVVDPILIFGIGPIPRLGTAGAALATVLAQGVGTVILILVAKRERTMLIQTKYLRPSSKKYIGDILHLGVPACIQSTIHASVGIVLNKYIAGYGARPIAVYAIGSQIESLSWMTSDGFSTAISAFMGQNYGAKKFERIKKGYIVGLKIVGSLGIFATILLFFGNEHLFRLFIPEDPVTILMGGEYLKILSISQFFMTLEIGTSGALNGLSLTRYPAIIGTVFNLARIPLSFLFMPLWGVNGIWASMSFSSVLKGTLAFFAFWYIYKRTNGFSENMEKYISRVSSVS
ncbi:MAG: MATE family efflux transporter [Tissierellia bacterium]|nr:MATE family efflux transporter [Tissierellia bacterium]